MCNKPRILVALKAECSPVIMLRVLNSQTSKINLHDFGTQSRDAVVGGPYMLIIHNENKRKKNQQCCNIARSWPGITGLCESWLIVHINTCLFINSFRNYIGKKKKDEEEKKTYLFMTWEGNKQSAESERIIKKCRAGFRALYLFSLSCYMPYLLAHNLWQR